MKQATTTIPIVMLLTGDPVRDGLVASLARPGGNITGMSNLASDTMPKLLEMLKAAVPKLSRVAVLVNPANPQNATALKNIQTAAQRIKLTTTPFETRNPKDFENAFAAMARQRPDAVIVVGDPLFRGHAPEIGRLALRHKLPFASPNRESIEAGGLLSYGADIADIYRRGAGYVDRILKGAKPAELPVEQPTRLELVINLKTAKALGITIPQELLLRANEVIE